MPDMTEVIGMSQAVGNYYSRFLFYSVYFNVQPDLGKLKFTRFTKKVGYKT